MNKLLKSLTAMAALAAGPAFAQGAGGAFETLGAKDAAAMLQEYGIKTEMRQAQSGAPSLVATTDGGAKFLIGFFECADAANANGCKQVMISTAQASGGIDFEDINQFNGQSSVTTVVYEPTNQILIFGRNVFMPGGIGRENFKLQVALFLGDMQNFVNSRRSGAKSVSFLETPSLKTKISSISADSGAPAATGAALGAAGLDRSAEVELAIANSLDVDFRKAD